MHMCQRRAACRDARYFLSLLATLILHATRPMAATASLLTHYAAGDGLHGQHRVHGGVLCHMRRVACCPPRARCGGPVAFLECPPATLLLHYDPEVVMKQRGVVFLCVTCVRDRELWVPTFCGVWYGTLAAQRVGGYGPDRPRLALDRDGGVCMVPRPLPLLRRRARSAMR